MSMLIPTETQCAVQAAVIHLYMHLKGDAVMFLKICLLIFLDSQNIFHVGYITNIWSENYYYCYHMNMNLHFFLGFGACCFCHDMDVIRDIAEPDFRSNSSEQK